MADVALFGGGLVIARLAGCDNIVVAAAAGSDNRNMIDLGRAPYQGSMAIITGVRGQDMVDWFAGGADPVVTGERHNW